MTAELTAVFRRVSEGYIAFVEELLREGSRHSVYTNRKTRRNSTVPRHRELDDFLARKICRDLDISDPGK